MAFLFVLFFYFPTYNVLHTYIPKAYFLEGIYLNSFNSFNSFNSLTPLLLNSLNSLNYTYINMWFTSFRQAMNFINTITKTYTKNWRKKNN